MFYALLGATLVVALLTSIAVARFFDSAVNKILARIIGGDLADAWRKYLSFAIVVVGVQGGVRLWELEKYVTATRESAALELNGMRWTLEIYRTFIDTLQSIAWVLLLFFLAAMIAYVIVRAIELKHEQKDDAN
ncbi:hypothetical protein QU481_12520 [Crenobacter sp. SG2303]|uniref:Uncharacterized protein n=1 Tax=Crenobacter oryzisoli TaxID=3056844 RepID=A0ABT7XPJ8_9NEIS|nr:hypothetical protein [Crenobacter sp. SG2303]MDN0075712.1 hypothetical protein [Crenobacter sp. SG2303]